MKVNKNIQNVQEKWNHSDKLSQLDQKLSPFGFRVNDKGEMFVIGERDGKEYKIGMVRRKVVSGEEMEKFLKKTDNQEREREREQKLKR